MKKKTSGYELSLRKVISLSLCFIMMATIMFFKPKLVQAAGNDILVDGYSINDYKFEPEPTYIRGIRKTNIYLNGKLIHEVVVNLNSGKILDNGKEVGFVKEVTENKTNNKTKFKTPIQPYFDSQVTPYVISPPTDGSGGIKVYISSYITGFSSNSTAVIITILGQIAADVYARIKRLTTINGITAKIIAGLGTFIVATASNVLGKQYYVNGFDTGDVLGDDGFTYRRTLLELYDRYSWQNGTEHGPYEGAEWYDALKF